MSLDVSGALLEGVRISSGNNPFTFPPRDLVLPSGQPAFDAVTARAEYVLVTDSADPSKTALEIADPDLVFRWARNESSVVRFTYDTFSQRWLPSPGGPPDQLGLLSNSPRLIFPVPDPAVTSAPFAIYVGSPARSITFTVQIVGTEGDFTPPGSLPAGTVQLSQEDGKLNFSQPDLNEFGGEAVFGLRQSFFDRSQSTGFIGDLPVGVTVDYFLFLNPKPGSGQRPRVRIGYGRHLVPVQVPDEASLGSPAPGTFSWSLDTGRVRFSSSDVAGNLGERAYYDGVTIGSVSPARTSAGTVSGWPTPAFNIPGAVGLDDSARYVVFAELGGSRSYWTVVLSGSAPGSAPAPGTAVVDTSSGNVFLRPSDVLSFFGWSFFYLDSVMPVDKGVSVQIFRSGVNGSGEAQVPDFTVLYLVEDQIVVDGITAAPFVMLPTVPVTDPTLEFRVDQGPSSGGTFTGELVDGTDPGQPGLGYLLDLDAHQLSFSNRKTVSLALPKPAPSVKLEDAAVSSRGLEVEKNGVPVQPGVDFGFDADAGLIEFTDPVGQNDPSDRAVSGTVSLPDRLSASFGAFSSADEGRFLYVPTGPNAGIYPVVSVPQSDFLLVSPSFKSAGPESGEIRAAADVIADRFWTRLNPPFKKFSLARAPSPSGPYSPMTNDEFEVLPNVSQVNLADPAQPGEAFRATYVALVTQDDGATFVPENRVENALFKVRQEQASFTPGSNVATFNPDGRTVNVARPIVVYLDGVTLDSTAFEFTAPGTLRLVDPILSGQSVVLDYWVEDAPGGDTNFTLLSGQLDLDSPQVSAGAQTVSLNGDQTGIVSAGSGLFVGERELLIAQDVSYDAGQDVTTVTLEVPAAADSAGAEILACGPVGTSDYLIQESAGVSTVASGTNFLFVGGDASGSYRTGTVVKIDGDPYSVLNSQYDAAKNRTKVFLAAPARRNYLVPVVFRSVRPVLFAGTDFQTARSLDLGFPFTLARMGDDNAILVRGVDYSLDEGGTIKLDEPIGFGDSLVALYVARSFQPAGTVLELNYAHAVAPGAGNGLQGQRLVATYNLYAPDTFFYRIETVVSFIPEVQDLLRQSAQSGGVSGPNTRDAVGQSNKDFGVPGPYFDEQHEHNLDVVMARLLKLYNDLINDYEDILSDLDGRIVGGRSGRFRFDGEFDNPPRTSYSEITNDIDDRIKLYDRIVLTGFFTFSTVPVYGTMADPNSLSRIFPTSVTRRAALNDQVNPSDFGETMGSLDLGNIRSVGTMRSAQAGQPFTSVSGTTYAIPQNGEEDLLVPPFDSGQDVGVYSEDGVLDATGTVSSAGPTSVVLSFSTTLRRGSILQDVSSTSNPNNHFYTPGRDLAVDPENGQIINITVAPGTLQEQVVGDEVVEARVSFGNSDIQPRRVPVLDGLELDDSGYPPSPRLRRLSESALLADELDALGRLGTAKVDATLVRCFDATILVSALDVVQFLNGPNAGQSRTVATILSPSEFTVSPALPAQDLVGSDFLITSVDPVLTDVLADEVGVLSTNSAGPVVPPSLIAPIDSELKAVTSAIGEFGPQIGSGTGTVTAPGTLTDGSANFTLLGVNNQTLVHVPSGADRGLYRVVSATATVLSVDTSFPYAGFPVSGSAPYVLIQPESFFSPAQFGFASKFLRETLAFLNVTLAWQSAPTESGKVARTAAIVSRQSQITGYLTDLPSILRDDNLYEMRYLWIQQRTDRKDGNLVRQKQAEQRRQESLEKLLADQKKLLIAEAL